MIDKHVGDSAVPYYSQRETFLKREGSLNPAQIDKWRGGLCGLMCASMIINRFNQGSQYTIAELLIAADKLGAFDQQRGWVHNKIVVLAGEYGIKAQAQRTITLNTMYKKTREGNLIIASVSPHYLHPELKRTEDERSGHLVVITGMSRNDREDYQLIIHDPGSEYAEGGQNMVVGSDIFKRSFSGNIIFFEKPGQDK